MFLNALNHQVGLDRHGMFLIGRLPLSPPRWRLPGRSGPMADERGFLTRYRAFVLDELEAVRHRIATLQGPDRNP